MPEDSQGRTWHDFRTFRAMVLGECLRLGAPRPSDHQLQTEYVYRRTQLLRLACWEEIRVWEDAQGRTKAAV